MERNIHEPFMERNIHGPNGFSGPFFFFFFFSFLKIFLSFIANARRSGSGGGRTEQGWVDEVFSLISRRGKKKRKRRTEAIWLFLSTLKEKD